MASIMSFRSTFKFPLGQNTLPQQRLGGRAVPSPSGAPDALGALQAAALRRGTRDTGLPQWVAARRLGDLAARASDIHLAQMQVAGIELAVARKAGQIADRQPPAIRIDKAMVAEGTDHAVEVHRRDARRVPGFGRRRSSSSAT